MDILTFILLFLICSIVLDSIIAFIIWLFIRHKAVAISNNAEELLEKALERL